MSHQTPEYLASYPTTSGQITITEIGPSLVMVLDFHALAAPAWDKTSARHEGEAIAVVPGFLRRDPERDLAALVQRLETTRSRAQSGYEFQDATERRVTGVVVAVCEDGLEAIAQARGEQRPYDAGEDY
jgi:hypothetical protein